MLDDGRLTDGQGRTVDFRNTVVVMTSNIGSAEIQRLSADRTLNDPDVIKEAVMGELRQHFRPEFINRIDEVVVFHGLDAKHIRSIAGIQLRSLEKRLNERDLKLSVSEAALDELAKVGFDPLYGARPLKRAISRNWKTPLPNRCWKASIPGGRPFRWTSATGRSPSPDAGIRAGQGYCPARGRDRQRVPSIMNEVAMPIRLPVRKPLKLLSCCQLPLTAQQPGLRAGFIFVSRPDAARWRLLVHPGQRLKRSHTFAEVLWSMVISWPHRSCHSRRMVVPGKTGRGSALTECDFLVWRVCIFVVLFTPTGHDRHSFVICRTSCRLFCIELK